MKSISDHVRQIIIHRPLLADMLEEGLLNQSALARKIHPEIESAIGEKVSIESIVIAINRLSSEGTSKTKHGNPADYIGDVTLQTGLTMINFAPEDFNQVVQAATDTAQRTQFQLISKGAWNCRLVASPSVVDCLQGKAIYETAATNLIAVMVALKEGHEKVLGVCAYIVSAAARNGVNLEEVVSNQHEMVLIIQPQYAEQALSSLT